LIGRKKLARISSTPGRTQIINFFNIDEAWIFVDLPGYGYAKVPERVRARWAPMIEEFLVEGQLLRLAVVIVDSRHKPTRLDQWMVDWLDQNRIPAQVVATKIDKVSKNKRSRALAVIRETLGVDDVIPFSAVTGEGKKEIWRIIQNKR
jgi:GTP-binding protein